MLRAAFIGIADPILAHLGQRLSSFSYEASAARMLRKLHYVGAFAFAEIPRSTARLLFSFIFISEIQSAPTDARSRASRHFYHF